MKIVTSREMREIDRKTIEEFNIDGRILMERAGISVVMALEEEIGSLKNLSFLIFCGSGNNGGDGFVVARSLHEYTDKVRVILLGKSEKMSEETFSNYLALKKMGVEVLNVVSTEDFEIVKRSLETSDIVIDAMLGIGLSGALRGNILQIVELINKSGNYVVSVDVPTGVDSDNGRVYNTAIKANVTVTFGLPKLGLFIYPARNYVGKLKIASIGIPLNLRKSNTIKRELITKDVVKNLIPPRPSWGHKGTFGKVLIVSGSKKYTGAPILVSLGALRSGCGLVYTAVPEPFNTIVTTKLPEVVCQPIKTERGFFDKNSISQVLEVENKVDAVVVGPGLSVENETVDFIEELLSRINRPVLLDADALNIISKTSKDSLRKLSNAIITPHLGEFSRIVGKSITEISENLIETAEDFAKEYKITLLLKGATTVITNGEKTFLNVTGNTGLAKGGSGDVLSGIIGSFMAQGLSPLEAAICGVYLHGLSAEIYSKENSERSMIAEEIADTFPKILKMMDGVPGEI